MNLLIRAVLVWVISIGYLGMFAQVAKVNVTGLVVDSLNQPLGNATVVLLNPSDSVIANFAITNARGTFELKGVKSGSYLLQSSFVGYMTDSQSLLVEDGTASLRLDPIVLISVPADLDAVEVMAERIPMLIKKDTIEYNADAFKTQPTDVVEDLLKQLPGVEVEDDGTVKAQGEEVKQVLVDGKEFFGRDPQVATKNLPAKSVEKVQVFDKKSDMAEFSGIDDGMDEKAINIELKEDYKKGTFGSAEGGLGSEERYRGKLNLNKFSENQQISLIGLANNINQQGFSINDYVNFAGGMSNLMRNSGGGRSIRVQTGDNNSSGIPVSTGLSDGFVTTNAGGLNLNQDFGKKSRLNISYFYGNIQRDLDQEVRRENILFEESFFSEEDETQNTSNGNHRINSTFDHKFDSTQNLRVRSSIQWNQSELGLLGGTAVFSPQGLIQNQGIRDNNSVRDNTNFSTNIIYRKRFGKKGRSFSSQFNLGKQDDQQEIWLQSTNDFFDISGLQMSEIISQQQFQSDDQIDYGIQLHYTEPLAKTTYLGLQYRHNNNTNDLIKDVYDLDTGTEILNTRLSNQYSRDYIFNRAELSVRWIKNRSNLSVATSMQHSQLNGELLIDAVRIDRSFTQFLPHITWDYDIANAKRLRVSYRTSVREPSLTQLQPIVDNSNPLSIYLGNPDLIPEYAHRIQLRYFSFSQFSMTNFFAVVNATYTENAIINARSFDQQFRQVTMPVNVEDDYRLASFVGFGTPLRFISTRLNLHSNFTYNRGRVFVNQLEEQTKRYMSSIDLRFDNINKNALDLSLGTRLSHSLTHYSQSTDLDQDYLNHRYIADLTYTINDQWTIGTKMDYAVYSGGTFVSSRAVPIWEASFGKFLFKKRGVLKISAFDILNENIGIQQTINLNYIEDVKINSLSQYFMVGFSYSLNPMLDQGKIPRHGMRVHRMN